MSLPQEPVVSVASADLLARVGSGPVGVDTACFIYFAEGHPAYAPLLRPLFAAADAGVLTLVTSSITLLEVLVVPYRAGDSTLANHYERLLTQGRGVTVVAADTVQVRVAAQLRARLGLRVPDAVQLATALAAGCTAFVTNDRALPSLPGLPVVQVGALG